jgi:hypothetical protein
MATNSLIELPPKRAIDKPLGSPTHEELVSVWTGFDRSLNVVHFVTVVQRLP